MLHLAPDKTLTLSPLTLDYLTGALVEAFGDNRKVYGFGLVDWRDGWFDGRVAPGRTTDVFCEQIRAAVASSKQRGRVAIVLEVYSKSGRISGCSQAGPS